MCTKCPENAICEGSEFECVNGTFKFYRICAYPGQLVRDYDPTSKLYYELQKAIYDIVVHTKDPKIEDVLKALHETDNETLHALDETDVRNLWTYESDNYYFSKEDVMIAHSPYYIGPEFALLLVLLGVLGLIAVIAF